MIFIKKNETLPYAPSEELIVKAAETALRHQSAPVDAELTIVLTDDAQLRELNRDYLGVDAPTDVLSFPADEIDPETGFSYLGDILISVPYATRQSQKIGNPLEAELQLLVTHGVLHLLGHDHGEPDEKARMWQAQGEILLSLGLKNIVVLEQ